MFADLMGRALIPPATPAGALARGRPRGDQCALSVLPEKLAVTTSRIADTRTSVPPSAATYSLASAMALALAPKISDSCETFLKDR